MSKMNLSRQSFFFKIVDTFLCISRIPNGSVPHQGLVVLFQQSERMACQEAETKASDLSR